jgi:LPS export ABC transporter protein LptC
MDARVFIFGLLFLALLGCKKEVVEESAPYTGPLLEADSIEILYSDSAIVRIRVEAAKQMEYENGNRTFPEGIHIDFFEIDGTKSSQLTAQTGYYVREEDRYTAIGDVQVDNMLEKKQLFTDTLHWLPKEERIFTPSSVVIVENERDTLRGAGMEADQNFNSYVILKPEGSTILENGEEGEEEDGGWTEEDEALFKEQE